MGYNCHNQNKKKSNKKKLFSEDVCAFSPVSLIDVSVLPRHFKFSSLYTMGWSAKYRVLPRPLSGYPFFYLCQGNLVYISCFDFSLFFPSCSLLLILISLLKCH